MSELYNKESIESLENMTDGVYEKMGESAVEGFHKIEEGVVAGYKKIEDGVVGGYKKMEETVVEGFGKVTDKFVEKLFAREGESVEEAKERLSRK